MLIKSILTGVAGTMFVAAMPAAAIVKIATYSGTVASGYDQTGVFAAPGSDLTGYNWVATYTYDKTLGSNQYTDGFSFDSSFGGLAYGFDGSPVITSTITINGVTKSISGAWQGDVYTTSSPVVEQPAVQHVVRDWLNDGITNRDHILYSYGYFAGAPASLDQNVGPVAVVDGNGYMQRITYDTWESAYSEYVYANFAPDMVYSVGNAVPEPASWALMIAGFGMVGGAARRRRSVAVTA